MNSEFKDLGFDKYFYAKGMRSIAGQFTQNNRCGIYILHFENAEFYVGLAIDVVNRYAQHRQNHKDIEYISFKEVPKTKLADVEKETVYALENLNKPLRNINIVSIVIGETDLDLVVTKEEQDDWLNKELSLESLQTERFDYPELRKKYSQKFDKLLKHELADEIKSCLRAYVLSTIPFPKRTEYSFWSLSCLPSTHPDTLSRLNIYWQETLVLAQYELDDDIKTEKEKFGIGITIWVSKSKLLEKWTEQKLQDKFQSLSFVDWVHESGGIDQQCVSVESVEFNDFLFTEGIIDAAKEFNLRLMRKGGCVWNRYHSFDLADVALDTSDLSPT
ncbi:MAG: GIY-YIG nuclease family protein [Chitinophagaceae bacterium]